MRLGTSSGGEFVFSVILPCLQCCGDFRFQMSFKKEEEKGKDTFLHFTL